MQTDALPIPGIPVLPEARMHLATPIKPCIATIVSSERCTASNKAAGFVRHIAFDVTGTPLAGNYLSGQSFGVIPPGLDSHGKPHKLRLYSIASPTRGEDGEGNIVATTVKRTIDEHHDSHTLFLGVASNYLCDRHPGDKVTLTGPSGKRFVLPAEPHRHDYLFLATGTGIAPFRGMLLDLLARGAQSRIVMVMGSPYTSDLLYHDDFVALAAKHSNFTYLTAISREHRSATNGPMYVHNRIEAARDTIEPLLDSERGLVYVCGIAGMELGVIRTLAGILRPAALQHYLHIDQTAGPTQTWDRRMLHKSVNPTRRVFLEVY